MLISIIIPAYNVENYIAKTLESIVCQDYLDFEVIIINDGSTDNTAVICDLFATKNQNMLVKHQLNQGVSVARNTGVNLAKGDYLWFIDGDDLIVENAISKLATLLKNWDNKLDVFGFSYNSINDKNEIQVHDKKELLKPLDGNEFLKHYKRLSLWTFLYRASLIKNNEIQFIPGIKAFQDNLFNIEVFNKSKMIIQTNHNLYIYRTEREGSTQTEKNYSTKVKSLLMILNRLNSLNLSILSIDTLNRIKVSFWIDFLYYFGENNKAGFYNNKEISKLSKHQYNYIKGMNTVKNIDVDRNFDVLMSNLFKSKYLLLRDNYFVVLLRKIVVKLHLIYK